MATIQRALVVGAGMAGLTQGLALQRAGIACEIVEIRPALTEPGTGISLQGPALRALREVGVVDACISRGFAQTFFKTCDAGEKILKLIESLDDSDDVQNVYANFEVSDALMQKMSA